LAHPVDFDASDGQPVDLVFALAVPEYFTQQHLLLLAELAERFAEEDYRAALRAAPDVSALHQLLTSDRASRSAAA
jgi:PTS system nitrogen regulatory IIA component